MESTFSRRRSNYRGSPGLPRREKPSKRAQCGALTFSSSLLVYSIYTRMYMYISQGRK